MNLWSYLPAIATAKGEEPITDPERQKIAHCGVRIGHLLPNPGDFWWSMAGPEDVERIAAEAAAAVRDVGLPYLDQAQTLEGVAALSGHIPGICTDPTESKAVALRLLGRDSEAVAVEHAIQAQQEAARAYRLSRMASRE